VLAEQLRDAPPAADVEAVLARAKEAGEALAAATKRAKSARAAAKQAAKAERDLEARVRRAGTEFIAQRDPLVPFGAPAPDADDVVASWRSLASWAANRLPDQSDAAARAESDVARLREERTAALSHSRARCRAAGLDIPDDAALPALVTIVAEAKRDAVARVERIDTALADAKKARRDAAKHKRAGDVARGLATLLRADRFERWLVTEALDVLVQHASITLYRLSGGQYSFACDDGGEFVVIDHRNADERRAARTLSGGETFQASLALALALSEQVATLSADARSHLDAIFLDEGFGTLDADALETVAGTIEHLGSDGRMVGIVTHVPALAERVPVRYRVVKNDRTSTVVREEG
jgi:exonuclease SbcC